MDLTQFHGGAAGGEAVLGWKHSCAPGFLQIPKVPSCLSRGRSVIPFFLFFIPWFYSALAQGAGCSQFPKEQLFPLSSSSSQGSTLPQIREQENVCDSQGNNFFPFSFSSSHGFTLPWGREQEDVHDSQGNKDREQENVCDCQGSSFSLFPSLHPKVSPCPGTGRRCRRMFPIPKGTPLPSLALRVPARTSDSCRVPELSLLQAGRLPGRIPGSRGSAGGDSAGITVKVIPRAASPSGQAPLMEAAGTEPSFILPHGKAAFPGFANAGNSARSHRFFSPAEGPRWDFPTRMRCLDPSQPRSQSHPGASGTFQRAGKAQFPESFRSCGDSRKRLLPALDPSPSRREKLRPGVPRVDNGIGNCSWDKLKPAQHSQTPSFLLFPRNPLSRVGML